MLVFFCLPAILFWLKVFSLRFDYFFLLKFKDKDSKRICKVLEFDVDTRLKYICENDPDMPKDFKGGFLIMRNKNHHYMYSNNLIQLETWRKELSSKCVLHSFHNDYEVIKLLGKGSFAKVSNFKKLFYINLINIIPLFWKNWLFVKKALMKNSYIFNRFFSLNKKSPKKNLQSRPSARSI